MGVNQKCPNSLDYRQIKPFKITLLFVLNLNLIATPSSGRWGSCTCYLLTSLPFFSYISPLALKVEAQGASEFFWSRTEKSILSGF